MTTCSARTHANHAHQHGPGCGHAAVRHRDHIDYLHDGHLHHLHEGHVDEHVIEVADENPLAGLRARHIAVALQLAARSGCRCPRLSMPWDCLPFDESPVAPEGINDDPNIG